MVRHWSPCKSPSLRYALPPRAGFFVGKYDLCLELRRAHRLLCKGIPSVPSSTPCYLGSPWNPEPAPSRLTFWLPSRTHCPSRPALARLRPDRVARSQASDRLAGSRACAPGPRAPPARLLDLLFSCAAASCFSFHATWCEPEGEPTGLLASGGMGKSLTLFWKF